MKTVSKEKSAVIAGLISSLQQPFEYVMGATLVIAQDQCFHFNINFKTYIHIHTGKYTKICECADCGKVLDKNELKRFMI